MDIKDLGRAVENGFNEPDSTLVRRSDVIAGTIGGVSGVVASILVQHPDSSSIFVLAGVGAGIAANKIRRGLKHSK